MTANNKYTVLSIGNKITTCECLDNGSSKSEITCEYTITVSIYFMYICLIIQTFQLSEQVLIPRGMDNWGSTVLWSYMCQKQMEGECIFSRKFNRKGTCVQEQS